jgi:hypothetical protein
VAGIALRTATSEVFSIVRKHGGSIPAEYCIAKRERLPQVKDPVAIERCAR